MIIFCAVYSITAPSQSSFSSAPLQSLSFHNVMHNGNRYIFVHPDPKASSVDIRVSTCCCSMCDANIQAQWVSTDSSRVGLFRHSLPLLLTLPSCCWLAPWQIPYPRTGPLLFLFEKPTASFSLLGFLSLHGIFFSKVLLPYGTFWSSPSVSSSTLIPSDLLFIYWFLLLLSHSFSTYLFTDALFSFFYTILSHRWSTHSTWPTTSLFSLNSIVLPNESNTETFAAFSHWIFFFW